MTCAKLGRTVSGDPAAPHTARRELRNGNLGPVTDLPLTHCDYSLAPQPHSVPGTVQYRTGTARPPVTAGGPGSGPRRAAAVTVGKRPALAAPVVYFNGH